MNERFLLAARYLKYRLTAGTRHDVHSPFVFALIEDVLRDHRSFYKFEEIERLRQRLLKDDRSIRVTDLGAGSQLGSSGERKLSEIARHAAKPPKFGQLFFRLVNYLHPAYMLELGTSLGFSSAYLAAANSEAKLVTLEGCPQTAAVAQENFSKLQLQNIELVTGNFDETLAPVLQALPRLDLAFLDGNHRKEPTLRYFHQCLTKTHPGSLLIFDDIHWTTGMQEAWKEIKGHPSVACTIDLFYIGLVFFREEFREKQHFVLKY